MKNDRWCAWDSNPGPQNMNDGRFVNESTEITLMDLEFKLLAFI